MTTGRINQVSDLHAHFLHSFNHSITELLNSCRKRTSAPWLLKAHITFHVKTVMFPSSSDPFQITRVNSHQTWAITHRNDDVIKPHIFQKPSWFPRATAKARSFTTMEWTELESYHRYCFIARLITSRSSINFHRNEMYQRVALTSGLCNWLKSHCYT